MITEVRTYSSGVIENVVYLAAEGSPAYSLGRVMGFLVIPGVGLAMLITGLRRRSASRRQPAAYPYQPYPHQPYPHQPYPHQPYPGQAPQPPPAGYPYAAAPPPPPGWGPPQKVRGSGLIAAGTVLLVLGLLGGAASALRGTNQSRLAVGDCITDSDYDNRVMRPEAVDCSRKDAIYELASKGDGEAKCPDGERERSDYSALTNNKTTYCFLLNLADGACVDVDTVRNLFHPAPCSTATAKVERRIDGTTDESRCGPDANGVSYPEPKRLYCFVSP